MKRIFSVFALLVFLSILPMSVTATSYVKGFSEGKVAGYEQGHEAGYSAGYNDGYQDRDREAQIKLNSAIINTAAIVISVAFLVLVPSTAGITAYFVNRKRDKLDYK